MQPAISLLHLVLQLTLSLWIVQTSDKNEPQMFGSFVSGATTLAISLVLWVGFVAILRAQRKQGHRTGYIETVLTALGLLVPLLSGFLVLFGG